MQHRRRAGGFPPAGAENRTRSGRWCSTRRAGAPAISAGAWPPARRVRFRFTLRAARGRRRAAERAQLPVADLTGNERRPATCPTLRRRCCVHRLSRAAARRVIAVAGRDSRGHRRRCCRRATLRRRRSISTRPFAGRALLPPAVVVEIRSAAGRAGRGAARSRRDLARMAHHARRRPASAKASRASTS